MTSWDWIKLAIAILALIVSVSTLVFVIRNNKRLFGRYLATRRKA